jgi:hypothetical protein
MATPLGQLGRLSPEVRNMIYEWTLDDQSLAAADETQPNLSGCRNPPDPERSYVPGLLAASKMIRQETLPIYYYHSAVTLSKHPRVALDRLRTIETSFVQMSVERHLASAKFILHQPEVAFCREIFASAQITRLCCERNITIEDRNPATSVYTIILTLPARMLGYQAYLGGWTDDFLLEQVHKFCSGGTYGFFRCLKYWKSTQPAGIMSVRTPGASGSTLSLTLVHVNSVRWARARKLKPPLWVALRHGDRWLRVRRDYAYGGFNGSGLEQCQPELCTDADCWHHMYQEYLDSCPNEWKRWEHQTYAFKDGHATLGLLSAMFPGACGTSLRKMLHSNTR